MNFSGRLLTVVMKPSVMSERHPPAGQHQHESGDDRLDTHHRDEEPVPDAEHERDRDADGDRRRRTVPTSSGSAAPSMMRQRRPRRTRP